MAFTPSATEITPIDPGSGDSVNAAQSNVINVLAAKYADSFAWAEYASEMLENRINTLNNLLGTDVVGNNLTDVMAAIDAITLYTPPTPFSYNSPVAPTYDVVPGFAAPTLGALLSIPAVDAITVGDAPDTSITFTNTDFTDTLLTILRDQLAVDIATGGTGLGAAEAEIIARETARENSIRAKAYDEVTTQFSARGFDMPPGALLSKQTEMNNESGLRLADSSTKIMELSAKLVVDFNKTARESATRLLELLSRVFDSKVVRDFEAEKTRVTLALEGFKQTVAVALARADLNKSEIAATVAANEGTIKVYQSEIEGQIAPMKAISDANQSKAAAFGSAVQSAVADLNAQVIPEELKLNGVKANAAIAGTKAEITFKEAALAVESAARQLALEVSTIQGLAQSAAHMVAAALNGVGVSSSFGFSGSASASENRNVTRGDVTKSASVKYDAPTGAPPTWGQ